MPNSLVGMVLAKNERGYGIKRFDCVWVTGKRSKRPKKLQSFDAAGADVGAPGAGASWTGADVCWAGAGVCFGVACFLAATDAGAAATAGRGGGVGAFAIGGDAGVGVGVRCGDGAVAAFGSGVMMLTGGVEAAEGNSALVGLPVGIEDESAASGVAAAGGAFHVGA